MNNLVTGGAGFIGSNFIRFLINNSSDNIVNLDLLTYAGNLENLKDIENNERYYYIKGDICNNSLVGDIFKKFKIDTVINFAAESHVDRSIEDPEIFLKTNVLGTLSLLEAAKKNWKIDPKDKHEKKYKAGVRFIQVSTDEVYGSLEEEGFFTENTPIDPSSPYSSSKASADMLVRAYWKTYGLPSNVTRCSNNYGPYQHPEKLIPLVINNAINGMRIPVYGKGDQIRDWLYVEDHCSAIHAVVKKGKYGEIYNIGGNNEIENIEIIKLILSYLDRSEDLIDFVQDRPGHDMRYAIDGTKVSNDLNWKPSFSFENGLRSTIEWYIKHKVWLDNIISGEYTNYYKKMYNNK